MGTKRHGCSTHSFLSGQKRSLLDARDSRWKFGANRLDPHSGLRHSAARCYISSARNGDHERRHCSPS
jgi:hypothetical protein